MSDGPSDLGPARTFSKSRPDWVRDGRQTPRRRRQSGGAAFGGIWATVGRRLRRGCARTASRMGMGVLRERSARRFLAAQLASISGDFMVIAALPFAVFAIGGSTAQVGVAFGAGAFFELLVVVFGGAVGDRHQRRSIMISADCVRFSSQAVLAILLVLGVAEFWQLLIVQIILGASTAFFNPAMNGFVPEVVPVTRLQDANALVTMAVAAGTMLGPAMAGALIATVGVGWAFALDALTFAGSALLLRGISVPPGPRRESGGSLLGDVREGWTEFRKRTWLWVVVGEFALFNALVLGPFQMLGASMAVESLGGLGAWATILTALGIGRIGGGFLALFWHPRRPLSTATLLIGSWAVPLTLLAIAAPVLAIALTAALAGAALSVFGAIWDTTLQSVPADQRSRMGAYDWLGSLALLPIGYFIAVGGQSLLGAEAILIAGACLVLAATAIVVPLPAIRGMRGALATAAAGDRPA